MSDSRSDARRHADERCISGIASLLGRPRGGRVDDSVLQRAFAEAIATQGVVTGTAAYVRSMVKFDRTRGWPPAEVMRILFPDDEIRAQAANLAFERSFQAVVDRFGMLPLPGANDALAKLTAAGIKVCLVSSLSRPALALIVEHLDWWERADLVLCADDVARGFPWPDLILTAVLRLGIGDVRDLAVVTGTEGGALSGPAGRVPVGRRRAQRCRRRGQAPPGRSDAPAGGHRRTARSVGIAARDHASGPHHGE